VTAAGALSATDIVDASPTSRVAGAFARARAEGRTAIIPYVTAGYPTPERSEEWVLAMVRGGADLMEIGVPFSDPLADGPTVQRTSQAALQHGVTLADAVAMVRRLREHHGVSVPILLMGYFNPMLQYGLEDLARDSAAAGVDGYIVPDLPAEESDELLAACRRHRLDLVFLLAPTSTDERIAAVAERASGFVYCVSLTGVTGQRDALPDLRDYLGRVRARTDLPLAVGFGVSTPEHVRHVGEVADGAVVASALINFLDTVPDADQCVAAEEYVRGLRGEAPFPPQVSGQAAVPVTTESDEHDPQGDSVPEPAATGHRFVACRGIRGATTVETNTSEDILEATTDLLDAIIRLNDIDPPDVVSAIFTTTPEITASFPAMAARELGWTDVPLLCAHEMAVPGALRGVVRILLHINTTRTPSEIRHVYLREAGALRPEWAYDDAQLTQILGRMTTAPETTA
jgi:tryptophan synthase alpha chain